MTMTPGSQGGGGGFLRQQFAGIRANLSATLARTIDDYDLAMHPGANPASGGIPTIRDIVLAFRRQGTGRMRVVDLGCGSGTALLSLAHGIGDLAQTVDWVGVGQPSRVHGLPDLPTDEHRLQTSLDLLRGQGVTMAREQVGSNWQFLSQDLEEDFPAAVQGAQVIVAVETVVYLNDELRFVERVYDALAPGGLALLDFDHPGVGLGPHHEVRRLRFADSTTWFSLQAAQQRRGIPMWTSFQGKTLILGMRKAAGSVLRFERPLVGSRLETAVDCAGNKPWGCISYYGAATP
jgi:SAM-dependent methyltransferase